MMMNNTVNQSEQDKTETMLRVRCKTLNRRNSSFTVLTVDHQLDFSGRVPSGVSSSVDTAEVDPVVPPHDLVDLQVSFCMNTQTDILLAKY